MIHHTFNFEIMALLKILEFPDDRLRKKAAPVEVVDEAVGTIIDNMFETMYEAPGVGLAATQVNIHRRIIVIDVSEDKSEPLALINPELIYTEGTEESQEGCLSVPEIYEPVTRAEKVKVRALNREGEPFEIIADALLAICIQHEIDHLNGKLFVDYLSPLKRQRIRKKLEKAQKQNLKEAKAHPPII